jgi:OOP family OmpA-OmpF porin
MKLQYLCVLSLLALVAFTFSSCATPAKAPLSADASPQAEINRASAAIEAASSMQYDRLAPDHFQRAVAYRNSAREKLSKGMENSKVLSDVSISLQAAGDTRTIGDANSAMMHSVLEARQYAVNAQAPQFQEKQFHSADQDLGNIGEKLEAGKYQLDAEELTDLEKRFSLAEVAARKRVELGAVRSQIEKATKEGAKNKTPALLEKALAKAAAAEQAIQMNPHNAEAFAPALIDAKRASQKLSEVLAIARSNNSSESIALTIWNQNQALEASHTALSQANSDSEKQRIKTKEQSDAVLADTQANASAEHSQMESVIASKDAKLDQQHVSIAALKSENREYANEEELKQKIDEIKKTFGADEAEVMKDGKNLVVRLKKMQFSTGRSELNPDSFATLRKVDTLISAVPVTQVTVEGHTDSMGTDKMNKSLSQNRAEAVKKYLLSQGLSESLKVATAGYGSDRPLTSNKTKDGRAINRRVDIVIETPATL